MSKETRTVHVKVTDGGSIKNASKGSDKLGKSLSSTGKIGGAVFSKLDSLSGGLLSSLRSIIPSIGGVSKSFKVLRMAIISTGIGALVIGVVALTQAFKRSEAGQNKMAKMTAMLGAFTGQLLDKVADLGEFLIDAFSNPMESIKSFANLIKTNIVNRFEGLAELIPSLGKAITLLFDGEFSAAGKVATDAVGKVTLGIDSVTDSLGRATQAGKDFVAQTQAEVDAMGRIADSRAQIDKNERELIVDRAKSNLEISRLRAKAEDSENFSSEDRLEFLKESLTIEEDIMNREKALIAEKLKNKQEENALGKSTKADLDEEAKLKGELYNKEEELEKFKRNILTRQKALRGEIKADKKKEAGEASAEDIAAFTKLQEDLSKLELAQLDLTAQEKIDRARANHLKELEAMKVADDEKKALREEINAYYDAEEEKLKQKDVEKANALLEKIEQDKMTDLEKLEYQKEQDLLVVSALKDSTDAKLAIENKYKEDVAKIEERVAANKLNMTIKAASMIAGTLSSLAAKGSKEAKAFGVAKATIDTYIGIAGAVGADNAGMPTIMKIAMATKAAATGFGAVRGILATNVSGGGGSPSAPSISPVKVQAPDINVMGRSSVGEKRIEDAITSGNAQPTRAYVVESEMASSQALARRVDDASSIG